MCFVRLQEQTASISPNSINWLDFVVRNVYCAVRTESLHKMQLHFRQFRVNRLVFVTDTDYVLCEGGSEFFDVI
jgi:hypothetical protein